ncbi:hypothetical protein [Paractinoplanes maris]|uniref:hypothetical protein n=1 Tax=Paractinoplanes maris TaxID=1734446 RepID=UPI00202233B8|nr:hypothetical protein [Actinoplanes maris]
MTTPVDIQLVLDTSAVVEFTRESIHVGEVLSLVADDNAIALLPLPCLVEAYQWAADRARLDVLIALESVFVAPPEPKQWRAIAAAYGLVGRQDAAVAALLALDAGAGLLTRQPDLYASVDPGNLVIAIED